MSWWALLLLPILLRALIPVGFMPMAGPDSTVRLVVCDGNGPLSFAASMPMSGMPADMVMDGAGSSGSDQHPGHEDRGNCPYGSAPALGGSPTLAILPPLLIHRSRKASLAAAQVAHSGVSPRAQSPRGPPA